MGPELHTPRQGVSDRLTRVGPKRSPSRWSSPASLLYSARPRRSEEQKPPVQTRTWREYGSISGGWVDSGVGCGMRNFGPMQNAEKECWYKDKRRVARWMQNADEEARHEGNRDRQLLSTHLFSRIAHSPSASCIGSEFRIPHPTPHPVSSSNTDEPSTSLRLNCVQRLAQVQADSTSFQPPLISIVTMHRFLSVLALLALASSASAQDLTAPLPADAHVVRGQFPNGLQYIIRRNKKPEKRAELRLVVNAGSILEDDAQRGLAHFVEHMMFDGTKRFPKQDIVNYLERVGMRFGADLNAYTSFDETVYMLTIPTDTARLVNSALDILQDWASGAATFDAAELKKERGVVIEEWRTGRDASTRVQYRQFPVMLQGSKYALRVPIGTKENLESFADSLAVKFYRDWYRPDLMTVIAVGDFDPTQMEASIKQRFAAIPSPKAPRLREYAAVPDHDQTLVSIETDKEYPLSSVMLLWLKPRDSVHTIADFRRTLVSSFYDGMVNARFSEISQRADAPFTFAQGGRGSFVRTKDAYQLFAGVKESGFEKAAEALLGEAERISRFGFTQTELDRQRTNLLRSMEQQYAERDKTNSSQFVDEYVSSTLWSTPIIGIEKEEPLAKSLAPTITVGEVNALSKTSFGKKNRVVLVAAAEKPEVRVPSAAAMLKVFDAARSATLTAYVDSSSDAALVPSRPAPGKIVAERALPETGIIEWTLSNGAKVLLKPTDFKADELLFAARSPGGESIVPDADVIDADLSSVVMSRSGVGSFNAIALGKKLAGKKVNVAAELR